VRKRFSRLLSGLARTRRAITEGIRGALGRGDGLDAEALDSIEETLIAADLGVETAAHLVEILKIEELPPHTKPDEAVRLILAREIESILEPQGPSPSEEQAPPETSGAPSGAPAHEGAPERSGPTPRPSPIVTMVAGVNGVGKTTTIGKLARRRVLQGKTVVLAAADTFRAAAGDQLSVWARRSGAQLVGGQMGGDAAAVAFDAMEAALARSADVLIVDTAGRLHTQKNLMEELVKIRRVLGKGMPGAPHEVLLVVDANTGQNALSQARLFDEALGLTGLVLAKMDGTARGGIVVSICRELSVPVRYIGTGEGLDDIEPFDPRAFARGLMGLPEADDRT
jgi:fused signal recognition particle receptor